MYLLNRTRLKYIVLCPKLNIHLHNTIALFKVDVFTTDYREKLEELLIKPTGFLNKNYFLQIKILFYNSKLFSPKYTKISFLFLNILYFKLQCTQSSIRYMYLHYK